MKHYIHVGCGNWGQTWMHRVIPQIRDVAECVALVDTRKDRAIADAKILGLPDTQVYTDLRQALEENPVDFVTVAVSIPAHREVYETILEYGNGCGIISEKPVAGTWEDCAAVWREVQQAGAKMTLTLSHRYEDDKQTLEAVLKNGRYGRINYLEGKLVIAAKPGRLGKGYGHPEQFWVDGGVHYIDMVRNYAGACAQTVYARGWNCKWEDGGIAASSFLMFEMQNNVRAMLEFSLDGARTYYGWTNEYFRVECEKASLELGNRVLYARSMGKQGQKIDEEIPPLQRDHWKHDLIIRGSIDWFDGGEEPAYSLGNTMDSMGMLFAACRSQQTGQAVDVPSFMAEHGYIRG